MKTKDIRSTPRNTEGTKICLGDIFERINKETYGNDLYVVILSGPGTYALLNLTNHSVYSFGQVSSPNDVFGSQKHTFIKVTEPVEIIVG